VQNVAAIWDGNSEVMQIVADGAFAKYALGRDSPNNPSLVSGQALHSWSNLYADEGGWYVIGRAEKSKLENPGFIFSDGRSAGSGHVDFRIKEGPNGMSLKGKYALITGNLLGDWQGHSTEVGRMRREDWRSLL